VHELGLTMEIVDAVVERAAGRTVRRVRVRVGRLAAVMPESLRFCFDLCTRDTPAEGAELAIDFVDGRARCRKCDGIVLLQRPWGRCDCGGDDLELVSGHELDVIDMEVE
jgi:hydrogenase nickel incorporation protein HypA/HybF